MTATGGESTEDQGPAKVKENWWRRNNRKTYELVSRPLIKAVGKYFQSSLK
jgi:hypothetical protein